METFGWLLPAAIVASAAMAGFGIFYLIQINKESGGEQAAGQPAGQARGWKLTIGVVLVGIILTWLWPSSAPGQAFLKALGLTDASPWWNWVRWYLPLLAVGYVAYLIHQKGKVGGTVGGGSLTPYIGRTIMILGLGLVALVAYNYLNTPSGTADNPRELKGLSSEFGVIDTFEMKVVERVRYYNPTPKSGRTSRCFNTYLNIPVQFRVVRGGNWVDKEVDPASLALLRERGIATISVAAVLKNDPTGAQPCPGQ